MPSKPRRRAASRPARKGSRKGPARRAPPAPKKGSGRAPKGARKAAKRARPAKKVAKAARRTAPATKAATPRKAPRPAKAAIVQFTETPREERPLRVALFGASGHIGSRIAQEALRRGHHVTAIVRHPDTMGSIHPDLRIVKGDVTDPVQVEVVARNHDVVASAIAPPEGEPRALVEAAKSLASVARAGKRVVLVGGAGSLQVASGRQLLDSPGFPLDWRPVALAHRDALEVLRRQGGSAWTVLSPSALIEPGERTGRFRWGTEQLLAGPSGDSRISMEDYAVAFVDELESAQNLGKRVTVGY